MARKKAKKTTRRKILTRGKDDCCSTGSNCGCGFGGYGLGVIGAAVYYISTATGFWNGVLGVLKSLIWPAFVVFEILKFIGA